MQTEHVLTLPNVNQEENSSSIDWEQVTFFALDESRELLEQVTKPMMRIFLLNAKVNSQVVDEICENSNFKGLKILQVLGGNLDKLSVKKIVSNGDWEELEELRLVECGLNDECLELLLNHSKLTKLKILDVSRNNFTKKCFENSMKEMKLPSLECLFVDENFDPASSDTTDKETPLEHKLKVLYTKQGDESVDIDEVYTHLLLKKAFIYAKDSNNPRNKLGLAQMLKNNYILPFETTHFHNLIRESASMGYPEAQYFAGMLFYKEHYLGDEFIENPFKTKFLTPSNAISCSFFEEGAKLGNPGSMYRLGEYYEYGKSVKQSDEKALEWYNKSADLNYPDALMRVAECHFLGIGTPVDDSKGIEFLQKAAENSNLKALGLLAGYYEEGKVSESGETILEPNLDLADQTYSKYLSILPNNSNMLFRVGCLHIFEEDWEGADVNYGISCLDRASKLGNSRASFTLGNFFLNNGNANAAYTFFLISKKQGHPKADEALSIFDVIDSRNPDN